LVFVVMVVVMVVVVMMLVLVLAVGGLAAGDRVRKPKRPPGRTSRRPQKR